MKSRSVPELPLTRQLLIYRLHWYAIATKRLVKRHWQWLAVSSLLPMALQLLVASIVMIFSGALSLLSGGVALVAMLIVALLWTGVQRASITGGAFGRYAQTLPLAGRQRLCVDVAVLLTADSLLFVPFVMAIVQIAASPLPFLQRAARCVAVVAFLSLVVAAQRFMLRARLPVARRIDSGAVLARSVLNPAARIEFAALFRERLWPTLARLAISFAVGAGALALLRATDFDQRAIPIEVAALALIGIVASGSHGTLHALHAPVRVYLRSLPLSKWYWPKRDTLAVLLLAAAPGALVIASLVGAGAISIKAGFATGLSYLLLVAVLRFPQLHAGRHAVVGSVVVAGIWSVCVYTLY